LALHWAYTGVHEKQPVVHLVVLPRAFGEADFVLCVVALNEVLHDATALEEIDSLAISEGVGQSWDSSIGVDGSEPGLFLGVFADVDFVDFVGETGKMLEFALVSLYVK
jgi:hypothetical protein